MGCDTLSLCLCRCRAALNRRKAELEKEAEILAGMPFNLAAPGECSNVLFTRLRLPPPAGAKRLKNGTFSTKVTTPRLILRRRGDSISPLQRCAVHRMCPVST